MANHYLQFSEVLHDIKPKEEAWLKEQLQRIRVYDGRQYAENDVPNELRDRKAEWYGYRFLQDASESGDDYLGFEYEFVGEVDVSEGDGRHFYVYSDDFGDPERVAHLIQKLLQKFRPDEHWSLSYASYCSTPRIGEFDGGAVFVTANEVKWYTAQGFIGQQVDSFEQQRDRQRQLCGAMESYSGDPVATTAESTRPQPEGSVTKEMDEVTKQRLEKLCKLANSYYRTDDIEIDPLQGEHELSVVEGEGTWVRAWVFLSEPVLEEHGLKPQ